MTVDPNTLKEGDVVHVRGELGYRAESDFARGWYVRFGREGLYFGLNSIVHVEPRPLKAGDTCIDKVTGWRGTIAAVDGSEAWVRWGHKAPTPMSMRPKSPVLPLSHLERAEG